MFHPPIKTCWLAITRRYIHDYMSYGRWTKTFIKPDFCVISCASRDDNQLTCIWFIRLNILW